MMDFWNKRYSSVDYAYGILPNDFLVEAIDMVSFSAGGFDALKGKKVLCLAEGEGRNAVFLAKLGMQVFAVDFSSAGMKKAILLADRNNVQIDYTVQDLSLFAFGVEEWDFIISIFCHTKPDARSRILDKAAIGLKRGGFFILEGYNLSQAQKDSGGPKDIDMLFSLERDVLPVFGDFHVICSENKTRFISEGTLHVGDSSVCRFLAQKHL